MIISAVGGIRCLRNVPSVLMPVVAQHSGHVIVARSLSVPALSRWERYAVRDIRSGRFGTGCLKVGNGRVIATTGLSRPPQKVGEFRVRHEIEPSVNIPTGSHCLTPAAAK